MPKPLGFVLCLGCLLCEAAAQVRLAGWVVEETRVAVEGALLALELPEAGPASPRFRTRTDQSGAFAFDLPAAGTYRLTAEREGYFRLEGMPVKVEKGGSEITVTLSRAREVHDSIDVTYSPHTIDLMQPAATQSVSGTDVMLVPYPSTHSFNNALRIMPGAVVQNREGAIHFNGGAPDQVLWTLDGFNVTDPLTGRFDTSLSVESARSLTLSTGRYSAEFGKGSAGALAVETGMGDDEFRYTATNFVPGVETRKGLTIGDWRPRLNLSGPIAKGRAWFFNATDAQYSQLIVEELPRGEDRAASYRGSNLTRTQVNLTPKNILCAGLLVAGSHSERNGLSVLDPPESTVGRGSRQYFAHIKNHLFFNHGAVVEMGYARNSTFGREMPEGEGDGLYVITPHGREGNYFVDASRWVRRDQALANVISPQFAFLGTHQFKAGTDLNWLEFRQDASRTGFERRRLDGTLRRRVVFGGGGALRRSNAEAAWYFQDNWRVKRNLLVELGVRQDYDRLVNNVAASPRFSFGWSPGGLEETKISGGYAIVHDAASLGLFSRHLDQYSLATEFDGEGNPAGGPLATVFSPSHPPLRLPRYHNWSLGLEQRLPGGFHTQANYLWRRGRNGFVFRNTLEPGNAELEEKAAVLGAQGFESLFGLESTRRDKFHSFEITVRKTFQGQSAWMVSYTRSRSVSNAALDISIDSIAIAQDLFGPTAWDSPNRLLSWGYFPLTEKYAISYMLEWRTGFPFSVEDDEGRIVGPVHSRRFPDFFETNLHLERKFSLLGQRWAFRAGVRNLTNRLNPLVVFNNIRAPNFLTFAGGTPRAYVTRIRWIGKQ